MVEAPRQHLPPLAHFHIHPPEAVDDPVLPIQEDQIGIPAHALRYQLPLSRFPQLVHNIQGEDHRPLQSGLVDGGEPPAGEVLAQQHAEHGGRGRVLPDGGGEVDPGLAGPGAEEQFFVPPQGKDHLVPGGLLDLLHPQAQKALPQLLHYAR